MLFNSQNVAINCTDIFV